MTVVLRNYLSHQALPNTWFMSVNTTPGVRMSPKSFNVFINSMLPLRPHQYGNSLWIIGSHEPLSVTVDKILWILENIILPGQCEDSFPNDLGNSLESRFPRKPGISVSSETRKLGFHLVLETTSEHFGNLVSRISRKLRIHPIPEWPRNPLEIRFPWFLGFLGNLETRTRKLNLFQFLCPPDPWSIILSYLLVSNYS